MLPRCTILTLGVRDLARARAFYVEGLGWPVEVEVPGQGVYLRFGPAQLLCLYDSAALAAELGLREGTVGGAVVLGHNVGAAEEVALVLDTVRALGARVISPAQDREWGGCSGFFADPEGYRWEVAYNPGITVGADGAVKLAVPVDPVDAPRPPAGAD